MYKLDTENIIKIIINKFKNNNFDFVIEKSSFLLKELKNNDLLWTLQGVSFLNKNDEFNCIKCLQTAIEINPKNIDARNYLGIAYKKLNNLAEAEKYYLECIKINPNYIGSLLNLANLKIIINNFDEAISLYIKALKIDENVENIYINLAHAYQSTRQFEKAKIILNKCLKKFPLSTKADRLLSSQINFKNEESYLNSFLEKLDEKKISKEKKIDLLFAIGKAFEDKKDYKKSFDYYSKGNSWKRNSLKSNINQKIKLFNSIKSFFLNFDFEYKTNFYDREKKIIFIFGLPRSGTTLIENIISSHDKVSSTGEINFLNNFFKDNEIVSNNVNNLLNLDLKKKYFDYLKLFNLRNSTITDKSLNNYFYLGFIKHYFPQSKLIHCQRNARDNCLSIYKNLFVDNQAWKYDEKELVDYYNLYKKIMKFWNKKMGKDILNIEYENLINNKEYTIKKIINYCELEWSEKCLNHHKNDMSIRTLSKNQANKPIYSSSIDSYKNYEIYLKEMFNNLI
jgi:tetratricopeptide (TPR) repeat protein